MSDIRESAYSQARLFEAQVDAEEVCVTLDRVGVLLDAARSTIDPDDEAECLLGAADQLILQSNAARRLRDFLRKEVTDAGLPLGCPETVRPETLEYMGEQPANRAA